MALPSSGSIYLTGSATPNIKDEVTAALPPIKTGHGSIGSDLLNLIEWAFGIDGGISGGPSDMADFYSYPDTSSTRSITPAVTTSAGGMLISFNVSPGGSNLECQVWRRSVNVGTTSSYIRLANRVVGSYWDGGVATTQSTGQIWTSAHWIIIPHEPWGESKKMATWKSVNGIGYITQTL
mgnify:CR=1 FL=1